MPRENLQHELAPEQAERKENKNKLDLHMYGISHISQKYRG